MRLKDFHFQDQPKPQAKLDTAGSSTRNTAQDDAQIWEEIKHIAAMALKCSQDNTCEAAWGERVYSRIFYSALESFHLRDSVGWENMCVNTFQLLVRFFFC
jgi:hypothetical protein